MLICHYPKHHAGSFKSAICVKGHFLQICVEPGCLNLAVECPIANCKSPIALSPKRRRQAPLSMPLLYSRLYLQRLSRRAGAPHPN
jgi:hypothetical protein